MRPRALVCLVAVLLLGRPTPAQAVPPNYSAPGLATLVAHAGYIFRGTVLAIEPARAFVSPPASPPSRTTATGADSLTPRGRASLMVKPSASASVIRITFLVRDAIRGVRKDQRITISEWGGLWIGDTHRYRIGDDVLLILYPASRAGLTSPVAGDLGRFAIAPDDQVLATGSQRRMLTPPAPISSRVPRSPRQLTYSELAAAVRGVARR